MAERGYEYPTKFTEEQIAEAVRLVNSGATWKDAAAHIGCDVMTLRTRATIGGHVARKGQPHARLQTRIVVPTSPTDRAYLAGLLDGEGHIVFYGVKSDAPRKQVIIGITNTHLPVMEWLASFGACSIRERSGESSLGTKPCYQWTVVARRDVVAFLDAVVPYMRIKKAKAEEALRILRSLT